MSSDLRDRVRAGGNNARTEKVIIQRSGPLSVLLTSLLNQNGIGAKTHFDNLDATAVELPISVIDQLAALAEVDSIVSDSPIFVMGHVTSTTGADIVRTQTTSNGASYKLDGTGIGIAVLDSGMSPTHKAFMDASGNSRIVYSQDFTGENRTTDPYGHGTHVASAAAGIPTADAGSVWGGVAPNAKLINLRVLNSQGTGTTSGLLSSLNWILNNRTTYNIRVVNMSLGMPAITSYRDDPLCHSIPIQLWAPRC